MGAFVICLRLGGESIGGQTRTPEKLYKLLSSYFEEVLEQNSNNLDPMNLTVIAKENDAAEISRLGFLVIAAAVQCEQNQSYIMQIRSLDEDSQHSIMVAIERIMAKFNSDDASGANRGEPADQGSADRLRPSEADEGTTPKALQDKLSRVQGQYVGFIDLQWFPILRLSTDCCLLLNRKKPWRK